MRTIVSSEWLHQNLANPNLIILDASLKSSATGQEFEKFENTIPKSRQFDLKNVFLDKGSLYPNTIAKPEIFELECRKLGICNDSEIVVFDHNGIYSSPRVWWLFKVMGHHKVSVLDGGLPSWITNGFQTEKEHLKSFDIGDFTVQFDQTLVVDFEQVYENTVKKKFTIVDARSKSRFNGTGKEPRQHLKSGRIENSVNIPYQEVLRKGKFKSQSQLRNVFKEKCHNEKELVFSCGSGMTACIVMLAFQIGYGDSLKLYDGSWTEWAEINKLTNVV